MRLLCDEDVGTGVPVALRKVGCDATSMRTRQWQGRPDTDWLPDAGAWGYLVFSLNKGMLLIPEERDAIIRNQVGIVYLTSGQVPIRQMLLLLLKRWEWLEEIDQQPKPFVHFLSPSNRVSTRHRLPNGAVLSL